MIIINDCHITKDLFRNISNLVIIEITDCATATRLFLRTRTAPGAGDSHVNLEQKRFNQAVFEGPCQLFFSA